MGSEAVAKRVAGDEFIYPVDFRSFLDRSIQTTLVNMMTSLYALIFSGNSISSTIRYRNNNALNA
jgi:hypothetical protein